MKEDQREGGPVRRTSAKEDQRTSMKEGQHEGGSAQKGASAKKGQREGGPVSVKEDQREEGPARRRTSEQREQADGKGEHSHPTQVRRRTSMKGGQHKEGHAKEDQ
ncbi:hypothetical protein C8J57DRAFT_1499235 [Mycena rebaudengoi]|nr:hypothetical protein C8J57DRAFT_1499235 [Mycena rebaudengoi]